MIACENDRWPVRRFLFIYLFFKNKSWNLTYILAKLELEFEKCFNLLQNFDFQTLNKILIKK